MSDISWLFYPAGAGSLSYTANALNQYSAVGTVTPAYDGNGNLTYDGSFTYCYDAESRLISVISAGTCAAPTTIVATYAYDGQGRRKSKTVGSTTTLTVTDADNREVLEYDGAAGVIQRWYAYGIGPDAVLNQMNVPGTPTRATLIPDIQGSIVGTLDSGSGALTKIGYLPFGENPGLSTGTYRYTGRRLDPETAGSTNEPSGLYYYRSRHLSPTLGRFLQPDSVGYAGGNNLYAYVGNDPLNLADPSGQFAWVGAAIGLSAGAAAGYETGGWKGAIIGGAFGAGVGVFAPWLSGEVGGFLGGLTGSAAAGAVASGTTFTALGAANGAGATVATNLWLGQPAFKDVGIGALIGGAAPVLSGETALIGIGEATAARYGLAGAGNLASAQTGVFGTIGAAAAAGATDSGIFNAPTPINPFAPGSANPPVGLSK